jgi:hypothetical protein
MFIFDIKQWSGQYRVQLQTLNTFYEVSRCLWKLLSLEVTNVIEYCHEQQVMLPPVQCFCALHGFAFQSIIVVNMYEVYGYGGMHFACNSLRLDTVAVMWV